MKIRLPSLTLALTAAAVAGHLLPGVADWLQYDRAAIGRGEVWRFFTGHLAHFGANHLAWDAAAFLALGTAAERESPARCRNALLLAVVAIGPIVWLAQPQFAFYRGLSGLASALFGLLAGSLLTRRQRLPAIAGSLALAGFAAKCLFEIATAQTVFATGTGYAPVPLSHLIGLGAGLVAALRRDERDTPTLASQPPACA